HVPFQGAAPGIAAVIGGQVDCMLVPMTVAEPNAKAGKVRLLGVAAPKRFPGSPDVPTFAEQGLSLSPTVWRGSVGPANLPRDVVTLFNRELDATLAEPAVRDSLIRNGVDPLIDTPEGFRTLMENEYQRWGVTIKSAGIKVE